MKKVVSFFIFLGMVGIFSSPLICKTKKTKRDKKRKKIGEQLYTSAQFGHLKKIKRLVEQKGADVNYVDGHSETALHEAADEGHLDVVKYLVEKGSKIQTRDSKGRTALWQAVDEGREDVVKYLLSKGAQVNIKSKKGIPLLQEAVLEKNLNIVKMLIEAGADPFVTNKRGKKPINYAKKDIKKYLQQVMKK